MASVELPGIEPLEVFRLGGPLTVFRITKSDQPDDDALLDSFKSNYELGRKPRRAEIKSTPVHMGISVYLALERAADLARALPQIGEYVARVELRPEIGAAFALTAEPGHLTVWGRPLQLRAAIADIVPVGG
jgi:hypothetical protein